MKLFAVFTLFPVCLSAQLFSVGVIGGVPFSDAVNSVQSGTTTTLYKSTNFTIGPTLQINLPLNFRFEADALYRPSSFALTNPFGSTSINANQWRYPLLLQYRLKQFPVVKPFVEAGASWEHLTNVSAAASSLTTNVGQLLQTTHGGFVMGAGVDVKVPFVRVSGELRYTRQGSEDFRGLGNLNQAEFLVGVRF